MKNIKFHQKAEFNFCIGVAGTLDKFWTLIIFIYKYSKDSNPTLNPIVNWKKKFWELIRLEIKELILERLKSYINSNSKLKKDILGINKVRDKGIDSRKIEILH